MYHLLSFSLHLVKTNCMRKLFYIVILAMGSSLLFAQEKEPSCSKVKSKDFTAKTPTLTASQIAETHKYDVSFYKLNLAMTNTSTYLSGDGTIEGKTVVATDSILFELFQTFTIDSIYFNGTKTPFKQHNSVVKVPVNLPENASFSITVFYNGTPPTAATNPLGGAGLSYGIANPYNAHVTWSLSEPFSAYEWFPVKQILSDKADSCAINITVDNALKAGSNGILDSITDNGNGTSTYHWFHRHPIAYYLLSVAVSDYVEYNVYAFEGTPDSILIQNYIYSDPAALTNFKNDIDETVDFMELFTDLYGTYPFADEKYGHSMAPINGGMEHHTMTTQGSFSPSLTSHELAHQWWGNSVTCASWSDIWLNEGFASYSEYLMYEHLYPSQASTNMSSRHSNIMSQPGGSVFVTDSTNENAIFNNRLTYNKGAAIIHIMRYIINDDTLFFKGLRNYLNAYKNRTATSYDFKEIMESTTNINLDDFFDQWYFGEGYPTYTVNWNSENDNLILNIKQTTSSVVTPYFTNPIDLKISRNNASDTIIRVPITSGNEFITIPNFPNIKKIIRTDPNNWIIDKVGPIMEKKSLKANIEDINSVKNIAIYPIPTDDVLHIDGNENESYTLEIIDLRGVLLEAVFFTGKYSLNVDSLPSGSYLLKITNNSDKSQLHRFMKR